MSKKKAKAQRKDKVKKEPVPRDTGQPGPTEKKLKPFYIVTGLGWYLDDILQYLIDRERTTIELLRERKPTKQVILDDLKFTLNNIEAAKKIASKVYEKDPEPFQDLAKEVLIIIEGIAFFLEPAYKTISELKPKKDRDLLYKHFSRACRLANEHRHDLEKWRSRLMVETNLYISMDAGTKPKKSLTISDGEWSKPMPKSQILQHLGFDGPRSFETWAKQYPGILRNVGGNRQSWQLRVDILRGRDEMMYKKFKPYA